MQPSASPDTGSGHDTKSHLIACRPMGPSVASSEKTASLNSFLRLSPRHKASLTASRNPSGKPTLGFVMPRVTMLQKFALENKHVPM